MQCYTIALFCDEEVVVLLTTLCEDVFAVEQVGCADGGVLVGEFFLVDAHAAALRHLLHFALLWEHGSLVGEQRDGWNAFFELSLADLELWHAFKHAQEGAFVDFVKNVVSLVAEKDL